MRLQENGFLPPCSAAKGQNCMKCHQPGLPRKGGSGSKSQGCYVRMASEYEVKGVCGVPETELPVISSGHLALCFHRNFPSYPYIPLKYHRPPEMSTRKGTEGHFNAATGVLAG